MRPRRFNRIGHVQEGRQELERAQPAAAGRRARQTRRRRRLRCAAGRLERRVDPERIIDRDILHGIGKGLSLSKRHAGSQRAAHQQLIPEGRVLRRVEIDTREHIRANNIRRETLAIVGVVEAAGQRQPLDRLEIDGAEDRRGIVFKGVLLVEPGVGAEELAGIARRIAVERPQSPFKRREVQGIAA